MHSLAYGHYRITNRVNDTTPAARGADDIVLSATEALTVVRPGRPTTMFMPTGVDPVAEVAELHAIRAANFQSRLALARANRQQHNDPYNRKLNSPVVSAIMNGVVYGRRHYGFDADFDIDEINGFYDTAMTLYHEYGKERDAVFEEMLVLVGSMREMKSIDNNEEQEPDGELVEDLGDIGI